MRVGLARRLKLAQTRVDKGHVLKLYSTAGLEGASRARVSSIDELSQLQAVAHDPSVESAVRAVREFLGMDVAYTTQISGTKQIFETVDGDAESFGVGPGTTMDLDQTYCKRVLDGRLPSLMPDVRGDPRAASLPITEEAEVGSFVSIPLRLSDGTVPGTLCAASHRAKPELGYRELQFLQVFARLIADQIERQTLEERHRGLEVAAATAEALAVAVAARDSYTGEHSRDVVERAAAVSQVLGLSAEETIDVERVALLHDLGKLGVPDSILRKPGPLTPAEWVEMRRHPILSAEMVSGIDGLESLAPALRAEHERWDGRGYPDGLSGERIPVASRITFVCDAYAAMTTDRPYRAALPAAVAAAEIRAGAGSQFCPDAAYALLGVLEVPSL
jgi:GAF domain-containing protein